jgi:rhodanese-related sulfurtransferase
MMIKKLFSVALLGTILWVGAFLGGGQPTALAASAPMAITETVSQTVSDDLSNLELSIDRFLTSIPSDYYTIASVEGLKNQLRMSQTLLVDVREQSEYQSGHIPKAINIPLQTLAHSLDQIPHDRPVVLYCSSGYRSAMGVMTLHLLGYENAQGFPPSFGAWKTAGEAIAKS